MDAYKPHWITVVAFLSVCSCFLGAHTAQAATLGTISSVPGEINQALEFEGDSTSNISVSNQSPYAFTSNFTISFWLMASSSWGNTYRGIIGEYNGTASGWDIGLTTDGKLRITLRGTSQIDGGSGGVGSDLRDNTWHHVVIVNSPTSTITYIDGTDVATTTGTWTAATNTAPLVMGNRQAGTTNGMLGALDEVRIFNRDLSPGEVATADTVTSGLVGYWSFDASTTDLVDGLAYDSSGNNSTGIFTPSQTAVAPVISNVTATATSSGALITWTTDQRSTDQVDYGLTTSYGDRTILGINYVTSHSVYLSNLTPNTTYHYKVTSGNAAENVASSDYTFTTSSGAGTTPPTPTYSLGRISTMLNAPIPALESLSVPPPYTCLRNWYVSSSGSNSNSGQTALAPVQTIAYVQTLGLQAGDCVYVMPGTYSVSGAINISVNGSSDTPTGYITFVSYIPHEAVLEPLSSQLGTIPHTVEMTGNYEILDGFEVTGLDDSIGTGVAVYGYHDKIINDLIHDNGGGGIGGGPDYTDIEGDVVWNNARTNTNQDSGIVIYEPTATDTDPGYHFIIRNNIVYGNGETYSAPDHTDGNGIILDTFSAHNYTQDTLVENNLVFGNGGRGIHLLNTSDVTVRNNTVFDNGLDPILTSHGEITEQVSNNDTYENNIIIGNPTIPGNQLILAQTTGGALTNTWVNNLFAWDDFQATTTYFQSSDSSLITPYVTAANGNIFGASPNFIDPANYNFSLGPDSYAIAAGTTTYGVPANDLAGFTRLTTPVDLGAYANDYDFASAPLNMTAPANEEAVGGTSVDLSATSSGSVAIANVQFRLDGANVGAPVASPPYTINWDSTSVANGYHMISAVADDTSGDLSTSSVLVLVDNTPPGVSITAPMAGQTVSGSSVTLTATSSDQVGVAAVQFEVDGEDIGAAIASPPYTATWDSTTVSGGSHTLSAVAEDTVGNFATSSISITVNNASAPTITTSGGGGPISGPLSVGYVNGSPTNISASSTIAANTAGDLSSNALPTSSDLSSDFHTGLVRNYELWDTGNGIHRLQQLLNESGFLVSQTGPGSPGQETSLFGPKTYRAVLQFQSAHGLPTTGFVGPLTRAALSPANATSSSQ